MGKALNHQKTNDWTVLVQLVRQQHAFLDACCREWQAGHKGHIFCHKGCNNCCSLAVNCTFAEALLIAQSLTEAQQRMVLRHSDRLHAALGGITGLKDYLKMHRRLMGYCPFLDSLGACTIYSSRPLSCRSLLSTREEQYCATDFGELPKEEIWAFLGSLDRKVVAFPTHYVAYSQQLGQQLENQAQQKMVQQFGFALSGNLPFLIDLELQLNLSSVIPQGHAATRAFLEDRGALLPFLLEIS